MVVINRKYHLCVSKVKSSQLFVNFWGLRCGFISILLRREPSSFDPLEPRWVQKETLKTGIRKVFTQLGYGVLFLQSSLELPSKSDAKYAQKESQHLPSFPRSRLSGCHATLSRKAADLSTTSHMRSN